MLPIIFIGLGIILFVLFCISFIAQPKSPHVIIVQNTDNLINDSNKEKNTGKVNHFGKVFCLIIAIICLIIGLVIQYASRGNDSFLTVDILGINTGNDEIQYQQETGKHTTDNILDSHENQHLYTIVVSEKMISFNNQQIGGIDQFEEYLKKIDRQHMIVLVDDFAVSSAFHKVEELLDAYGMKYEMESDE